MATLPGTEPALDALPLTVSGFQKELQAPSQSTLLPAAASWSDAYSAWPLESTRTLPAPPISSTDTVFPAAPGAAAVAPPPPPLPQAASVTAIATAAPRISSFFIGDLL